MKRLVEAGSKAGALGVIEGHVRDEERGHGSDPQHLPDGGLQVGQPAPVTEVGASVRTHLAVQFLLDAVLNLSADHKWNESHTAVREKLYCSKALIMKWVARGAE